MHEGPALRLAIFDFDGTLTQTSDVDNECFRTATARALGVPEDAIDWTEAPHVTDSGILAWLFEHHHGRTPTPREAQLAQTEFMKLLELRLSGDTTRFSPIPGAPEVFDRLTATGWTLAMATGCWTPSARLKLAAAGIPAGSIPLICSDDAPMRATLLERAIASAGNPGLLERVVSVGDGLWDVKAAVHVAIPFVGIGAGAQADRLRAAGATHVLPDLSDHPALCRALEQAGVPANGN